MKISTNHIRYYQKLYKWSKDLMPNGKADLVERIGSQLGAIEEMIFVGLKFDGLIITKIVSCEQHPNADRLRVCKIDDGGKAQNVERDENGHIQVVCGAPNARVGITVVWLPPDTFVPESFDKSPFRLEARALRGIMSNGMLASPRELTLGDNHDGILEIDEDVLPGTDFAEYFGLKDDVVFDIENKMFTHRPDCFGVIGVAREIAGIQRQAFKSPDWYKTDVEILKSETVELTLVVQNDLPELVQRFTAITMSDIKVGPSPVWLQVSLARLGLRSINNIVDLTNYNMMLTGQPLHAYDYDKVAALSKAGQATITIRHPRPKESVTLLNGKEIEPRQEAVMIASDSALIGIGGVMGGADTEVDETTRNIIIEVANFDMYSIRRTSMEHGIFTDAVTRFTKGQSPLQNRAVLAKMVDDVRWLAGGKVASELIDIKTPAVDEALQRGTLHAPVSVDVAFINSRLGLELPTEDMISLLTNVEFDIVVSRQSDGDCLIVKAPFWRTDIEIPEDVVEEVGRLYGYDQLPLGLPLRPMAPAAKNPMVALKQHLRQTLSEAGANELLTYSFVHGKMLDAVGQKRDDSYQLSNALSPDLQYYRQSLTPSLLDKVHNNIKAGYDEFVLFEIGKGHFIGQLDDEALPVELDRLAVVYAASDRVAKSYNGAAFYYAKQYLVNVLQSQGLEAKAMFEALEPNSYLGSARANIGQYETGRTAVVRIGDVVIGEIGEYTATVRKTLKLPDYCAGFELDLQALAKLGRARAKYVQLSRFPKVEQDLCLKVATAITYQDVYDVVYSEIQHSLPEDSRFELRPVDIYQRPDDAGHKQITLRLSLTSYQKTLRDSEVASLLEKAAGVAAVRLNAEGI